MPPTILDPKRPSSYHPNNDGDWNWEDLVVAWEEAPNAAAAAKKLDIAVGSLYVYVSTLRSMGVDLKYFNPTQRTPWKRKEADVKALNKLIHEMRSAPKKSRK